MKKYIIFNHFNPDDLYLISDIPENSWIWDSDWIVEDVSNYNGQCMISNNNEDIRVWKHPESLEEIDKKLFNIAKKYLDENPNEDEYWDEDYLLGGKITREDIKKGINNFHIYSNWIENSYVDGDSASQYQLMDLDDNEFTDYYDFFEEDEDENNNNGTNNFYGPNTNIETDEERYLRTKSWIKKDIEKSGLGEYTTGNLNDYQKSIKIANELDYIIHIGWEGHPNTYRAPENLKDGEAIHYTIKRKAPLTKMQLFELLKSMTKNFTQTRYELYYYYFKEDAESAKEILQSKGYKCKLKRENNLWYLHIWKDDGFNNPPEVMNESYSQLNQLKEALGTTKFDKIQSLIKECLNEGMEVEITIPKNKCKKK